MQLIHAHLTTMVTTDHVVLRHVTTTWHYRSCLLWTHVVKVESCEFVRSISLLIFAFSSSTISRVCSISRFCLRNWREYVYNGDLIGRIKSKSNSRGIFIIPNLNYFDIDTNLKANRISLSGYMLFKKVIMHICDERKSYRLKFEVGLL